MPLLRSHKLQILEKPIQFQRGPTGPPGADGTGANLSLDFSYVNLSSVLEIGQLGTGQKIFVVHLIIIQPFNNNLSLSVGVDSGNALISEYSAEDCAEEKELRNPLSLGTEETVKLYPYYTVAPTTGAGNITIYYL